MSNDELYQECISHLIRFGMTPHDAVLVTLNQTEDDSWLFARLRFGESEFVANYLSTQRAGVAKPVSHVAWRIHPWTFKSVGHWTREELFDFWEDMHESYFIRTRDGLV